MAPQLSPLRWTALALSGVAFLLILVVQFIPFATFSTEFFGATADADAYVWEAKFHAELGPDESSDQTSWYDNDFDDDDGIGMVRAAAPLLVAGGVVALASVIAVLRLPALAAGAGILSAVLLGLGIFLLARGIASLFDDQQEWALGFWFAIAASVLAAAAGVLGLLSRGEPAAPSSL